MREPTDQESENRSNYVRRISKNTGIKFAAEIVEEIESRGEIKIPEGYINGEAYEEWLYEESDNHD